MWLEINIKLSHWTATYLWQQKNQSSSHPGNEDQGKKNEREIYSSFKEKKVNMSVNGFSKYKHATEDFVPWWMMIDVLLEWQMVE